MSWEPLDDVRKIVHTEILRPARFVDRARKYLRAYERRAVEQGPRGAGDAYTVVAA
jgi:hypothetical protein